MTTPNMSAPLSGCVTIDATTPDSYLDNARFGTGRAGPCKNTQEAAEYLLSCGTASKYPTGVIVGHGAEGVIETCKQTGQRIGLDNVGEWTPLLTPLAGQFDELFLFGANVGAGDAGAQLLYQVAQVINAPVSAPTGLIYCNSKGDFMLEPGAVWQTALPNMMPVSIDPPFRSRGAPSPDDAPGDGAPLVKEPPTRWKPAMPSRP